MQTPRPHPRPLLLALVMVLLGLVGILSQLPALPRIPGVPRAAMLVNPSILLVTFAVVGAYLAPRAGLSSRIADSMQGIGTPLATKTDLSALGIGRPSRHGDCRGRSGPGAALAAASRLSAFRPAGLEPAGSRGRDVLRRDRGGDHDALGTDEPAGLGGLAAIRAAQISAATSHRRRRIFLAALVFAAGHLPVLIASGIELTAPLVTRIVAFNTIAGIVFGWLYAGRDLESAMIAHAGFHVGATVAALTAAHL